MRAITAMPGRRGSVGVQEVSEPADDEGAVLVRGLLMGVCGTDREIAGSIVVGRIRSFKAVCGRVTVPLGVRHPMQRRIVPR